MSSIIAVQNLGKKFHDKTVVDCISFEVQRGSLFAFLGQNGAGKTTTINMIIGLLQRDGGDILYDGVSDFTAFKNKIGVVFQNNILDDLLTVEENLLTYGALYIKSRTELAARFEVILDLLSLRPFVKQRFKTLSGGQKRKAEIARALFMSPAILFLDEPTTGLDPKTRAEVWQLITALKNEHGMTIFLTTHYMEETAAADSVAIIDRGKIIATGSPAELKAKYTFDQLRITPFDAAILERQLAAAGTEWQRTADTYTVRIDGAAASIDLLVKLKDNIRFYEVIKGSMDDVFLNVVGKVLGTDGGAV